MRLLHSYNMAMSVYLNDTKNNTSLILIFNIQRDRERGVNGLFIKLVPKVLNKVFLFVGSATLRTLMKFNWLVLR